MHPNLLEARVLDLAVNEIPPLDVYGQNRQFDGWFNRPGRALPVEQRLGALLSLWARGLVFLCDAHHVRCNPDRPTIESRLSGGGTDLYYALTPDGAGEWERLANPDWGRFFHQTSGRVLQSEKSASFEIQSRSLAERWLDLAPARGHGLVDTSTSWRHLTPWRATYWKSLPEAWGVSYRYRKCPPSEPSRLTLGSNPWGDWYDVGRLWDLPPLPVGR